MIELDIDRLFETTLLGDYDDDAPWAAVHELRSIGTQEVFEKSAAYCISNNPLRRARGADVLAQIGRTIETHENSFLDESYGVVATMLISETALRPICSGIFALGHIGNSLALPLIVGFATHPDCEVRYAVACALGAFPNDLEGVKALLALSQDNDEDVRDWATFGFGVLGDLDTPLIRDTLFLHIHDPFEPVRMEAYMGLAMRKDPRIGPMLHDILRQKEVLSGYIDAVNELLGTLGEEEHAWKTADYMENLRNFPAPIA